MRKTNQQFLDLLNEFIELTLTDLTKLQRIKYETMVTIHVHQVSFTTLSLPVYRFQLTAYRGTYLTNSFEYESNM